ncbi:MAG TPA: MarR family transcriptional regulator [Candidatus Limnocylindrales bacterium]|nr:MarR family transcriptional regulator [Candidatus Limnocylindrales bacterium]
MRTIDDAPAPAARIAAGIHDMIAGFRCAGTARLVKAGVSMTHMHVLWLLEYHGDLAMSRMADLLDVSLSNATGIVDRMAERGLVERVRVPDDRRVVLVRIAAGGLAALDEIEAVKQDRLQSILGHLDPDQLDRVVAALDDLRGAVAAEFGPELLAGHDHIHHPRTEGRA